MTDGEWSRVLNTNLSSVFYCSRAVIPHMVSEKSGKIINISSIWGDVGASCEAAYSASKSGIHGLTKALAKELAPSNIQVNAVACGAIDTVMNSQLNDEERKELEEEIPAGRFGPVSYTHLDVYKRQIIYCPCSDTRLQSYLLYLLLETVFQPLNGSLLQGIIYTLLSHCLCAILLITKFYLIVCIPICQGFHKFFTDS